MVPFRLPQCALPLSLFFRSSIDHVGMTALFRPLNHPSNHPTTQPARQAATSSSAHFDRLNVDRHIKTIITGTKVYHSQPPIGLIDTQILTPVSLTICDLSSISISVTIHKHFFLFPTTPAPLLLPFFLPSSSSSSFQFIV